MWTGVAATGQPDHRVVEAAQQGALWAQDELVGAYLPLVYNIVGRALDGHADVDDVVQETMLRALRGIHSLHHPAGFRSWLVAITMNQIRSHRYRQRIAPAGSDLREAHDVADPGADFVDLTIIRLGLEGQRREVAEATRWLDHDDRTLLSLWWLEAVGELSRPEVAAALELSTQHTAVRVQRMKAQLETARLVVRALSATPLCSGLAQLIEIWDGHPSALWRKRIARHARDCALCSDHQAGLVPAEGLLVGLGLVPVAAALTGLAAMTGSGDGVTPVDPVAFDATGRAGRGEATAPGDEGLSDAHVDMGVAPFPDGPTAVLAPVRGVRPPGVRSRRRQRRIRRRRITGVAAAVAVLITGGTIAALTASPDGDGDSVQSAADARSAADTAATPSPTPTASASPSPAPSKSPSSKPSPTRTKPTSAPPKPKTAPPTPTPTPTPTADPVDTPAEQVLAIANTERAKAGCNPLKLDDRLMRAAQLHSEDMSANHYFGHTSLDGRNFGDRVMAQGYPSPGAENIARGQNSPEVVMNSWLNSPGHRDNLLNCSLTTMGLGLVDDDWTWTQVFGF